MEKQKHTKGPWTASIGNRGAHIHVANDANHPLSFGFQWNEFNETLTQEAQANAALIAKAWLIPELLEATKRLLAEYQKAHPCCTDHEAEAAIAKAAS